MPRLAYKPNNAPTESSRLAKKCRWSRVSVFHLPLVHTEHKKLLLDGKKKLPLLISVQTNLSQQVKKKMTELLQKAVAYKSTKVTCDESL